MIVHVIAGRPQLACIVLLIARAGVMTGSGGVRLDEFYVRFVSLEAPGFVFLNPTETATWVARITLDVVSIVSCHVAFNWRAGMSNH